MRWGRDLATAPPLIAVDESPDWVFLAGCSPAEPASASPAGAIMPVINLARQCFSSERRNVAYPVVSAQGSTPIQEIVILTLSGAEGKGPAVSCTDKEAGPSLPHPIAPKAGAMGTPVRSR